MSLFETFNFNPAIERNVHRFMDKTTKNVVKKKNAMKIKQGFDHSSNACYEIQRHMIQTQKITSLEHLSAQKVPQLKKQTKYDGPKTHELKPNFFDRHYCKKVSQNSLKISDLEPETKNKSIRQSGNKFSSIGSNRKTESFVKPNKNQESFIGSFTIVQKTIQDNKAISKKRQTTYTQKFKEILQSIFQKFSQRQQAFYFFSKASQFLIWKIVNSKIYLTTQLIAESILSLTKKYDSFFRKREKFIKFIQLVLVSDIFELYESQKCIFMDLNDQKLYEKNCMKKNQTELEHFSFNDFSQNLTDVYKSNPKSQQTLDKIVEEVFLTFFVSEDPIQKYHNKQKEQQTSYLDQQFFFNNYEFHSQAKNLSSFVPSYAERTHFLLDKFEQNERIFDDEEKLLLLLKLSRDPLVPGSSEKYISHISILVEEIFGMKTQRNDQQREDSSQDKNRTKEMEHISQQADDELKEWKTMFGDLIMKI